MKLQLVIQSIKSNVRILARGRGEGYEGKTENVWEKGIKRLEEREREGQGKEERGRRGKGQGSGVDRWVIKAGEKRWKNEHL